MHIVIAVLAVALSHVHPQIVQQIVMVPSPVSVTPPVVNTSIPVSFVPGTPVSFVPGTPVIL